MLQIGRLLVRSQLVSLEFFIDIKSFRSHYAASNRNEYQEHFLWLRRPVRKADNLTTILCCCHEIWNPLGHCRPVTGLLYLFIKTVLNQKDLECVRRIQLVQLVLAALNFRYMLHALRIWVYVLFAFPQNNLFRLFTVYIFISENSNNLDQQFQAQH